MTQQARPLMGGEGTTFPVNPQAFNQIAAQARRAYDDARAALAQQQQLIAAHKNSEANVQHLLQETQRLTAQLGTLQSALSRLEVKRSAGDPGIQRIENMPGRRIPFDISCDIALPAGDTNAKRGTITVTQEGPFVATSRWVALISLYQFQYTDPDTDTVSTFQGRSFGRYRPTNSAWDLNDGQVLGFREFNGAPAFPGNGNPAMVSPVNVSSFRSMGGDFRINFANAGSSFPRQNNPVPSTLWSQNLTDPFKLGALDVFERGEVWSFDVQPLHVLNPAFGNVAGFGSTNSNWPFVGSQFDVHEGISDPELTSDVTTDPIVRVPNAILVIGYSGYLIVQEAGPGPY